MPGLESLAELLALSLSFRWFVFRYKYPRRFWEWAAQRSRLINELYQCPYCQTIEASTVVYALLYRHDWRVAPFALLFNGWVAVLMEAWVEGRVEALENRHEKTAKAAVIGGLVRKFMETEND